MFSNLLARARWLWPALLSIASVSGCDPCAGVAQCGGAEIRYRGELIERYSGKPLANARIEFIPAGGVAPAGKLEARTDSMGRFELSGSALGSGQLSGRLDLYFDDGTVVDTIQGVNLATVPSRADSRQLGSWRVDWPHFETYGQLYNRATRQPAVGIEVEFRRTGGVHARPDTFVVKTDSFGNFALRPRPLVVGGEIIGDVIIQRPGAATPLTIRGVRLRSYVQSDPNPFIGRWALGPNLPYVGRAVFEGGTPATGVEVRFQRTGGIRLQQEQYVTTTDANGAFSLGPTALEAGVVDFTLTFTQPAPFPSVTYPYSLRTTDDDGPITLVETWVLPR